MKEECLLCKEGWLYVIEVSGHLVWLVDQISCREGEGLHHIWSGNDKLSRLLWKTLILGPICMTICIPSWNNQEGIQQQSCTHTHTLVHSSHLESRALEKRLWSLRPHYKGVIHVVGLEITSTSVLDSKSWFTPTTPHTWPSPSPHLI